MNDDIITKGITRNRIVYRVLSFLFGWIICLITHFHYKKYRKFERPTLILTNHNSDMDPLMLVIGLKTHFKYVASANILEGFKGKVIRYLVNPIPRAKGASADETVALIIENLRAGINVAMFAEGNKSWDGLTCYISPRTAHILKEVDCNLLTYRFDGDYLANPRWADKKRKGRVDGAVVGFYSIEQLSAMTEDQIYASICNDLYTNAFDYQKEHMYKYKGKNLAEGFDNMAYICPVCHSFDSIQAQGDTISCQCGLNLTYNEYGFLESKEPFEFDDHVKWNDFQKKYMAENKEKLLAQTEQPFSTDKDIHFYFCESDSVKKLISNKVSVKLFGDRFDVVDGENISSFKWKAIKKMGMFRNTCLFFTIEDKRYELRKKKGFALNKYFSLWRILSGKKLF